MIIEQINSYMKQNLWLDFEVVRIGVGFVELRGFIDEAYDDSILIRFKSVYMVSLVTSFTYKGNGDFISIIHGDQAFSINSDYDVPKNNNIYSLTNTNVNSEMIIIAEDVEMEVFN